MEGPAKNGSRQKRDGDKVIATEPNLNIDDLPKMLIDTATRAGMSGSPVLAFHSGGYQSTDGSYTLCGGNNKTFLGVYSSRRDELTGLQLGEVWKETVVDEIIAGGKVGKGHTIEKISRTVHSA